jgi:RecB family endonuclease NucS
VTEQEMEDLLWNHPDKLLNEQLKQFRRQPRSGIGRADLMFTDRLDHFLVIEVKRGTLPRGAIEQLNDYYGMLKKEFPDRPVELMAVANVIPPERRIACERYHIEPREISEKKFRAVADEVGYVFKSEQVEPLGPAARLQGSAPDVVVVKPGDITTSKRIGRTGGARHRA